MNKAALFKVLANAKRLEILYFLKNPREHFTSKHCDVVEVGVCVGLIEEKIGLSQSTVSQYLAQLEQANLITMKRHGQWTYCKRNEKAIEELLAALKDI